QPTRIRLLADPEAQVLVGKLGPRRQLLAQARLVRHVNDQGSLQLAGARQQAIEEIEFLLNLARVAQPGDAEHFLNAEPERLAVFEEQGGGRADAETAVAVEVAAVRLEELAAAARVFLQGQQIVQ